VVGVDATGAVGFGSVAEASSLATRVQKELAYHEVTGGVLLPLAAVEVWLFTVDVVEQLPDAAGLNDPLCLYGTLLGPLPRASGLAIPAVAGQLTVTRGDLLDGLVSGARRAFLTPRAAGEGGRFVHALLPGDRPDAIAGGRGLVVALPLAPPELAGESASNEIVVAQLLYDVLSALVADAQAAAPGSALARMALPVPSRALLQARLEGEGWTVQGDFATRRPGEAKGLAGILGRVAQALAPERVRLPEEGSLDAFVGLAEAAVASLPGACCPATVSWRRAPAIGARERVRAGAPLPLLPPRSASPVRVPRGAPAKDDHAWVADFVAAHERPGKRSTVASPARAVAPSAQPPWMRDFEPSPLPPSSSRPDAGGGVETAETERDPRPAWMRDFEG